MKSNDRRNPLDVASSQVMKKGVKLTLTVAVALVAITVATWMLACGDCLRETSATGRTLWPSVLSFGSGSTDAALPPAAAGAPEAGGQRPLEGVEKALFDNGPWRGTEYPAWGTPRGEQVKPNRALRDRFDHYLLALNETSPAELSALVLAHATRDLGPGAAAEIRNTWDRYLQLQLYPFQQVAMPGAVGGMQAALQEHQQVRQRILGVHWAQAFYGDDGQALADALQPARNGEPAKTDAEAAKHLRNPDDDDAVWEQRLAKARTDLGSLQREPGFSAAQRAEAIQRYLETAFPEPNEQMRARGLAGP